MAGSDDFDPAKVKLGSGTIGRSHQAWSSRAIYIVAAIGATVGLGNLWRFPYAAGSNGGGAFVLVYLLTVFLLAAPLFMAETLIGRAGRRSPPNALKAIARQEGFSESIKLWGYLCFLTTILVLSFFSVIAGFSLQYMAMILTGDFAALATGGAGAAAVFGDFLSDVPRIGMWHTVFALATALIVGLGVRGGLEVAAKYLMPVFFLMLLGLVGFAAARGDMGAALRWLFTFDASGLTAGVALAAVGQAFFTMSVGSGGMLTYGAYIGRPIAIARSTVIIAVGDTLVALLAGLAIFPIVFGNGLDPAEGAGLVFVTMPVAFAQMPQGAFIGFTFFLLFTFAAITTSIALLETIVSYIEETRSWPRLAGALLAMGVAWALGFLTILSFGEWETYYPLSFVPGLETLNPFALIDGVVTYFLLPVTGVAFSLIAGWVIARHTSVAELGIGDGALYGLWRLVVRWVAPIVVLTLLVINLV